MAIQISPSWNRFLNEKNGLTDLMLVDLSLPKTSSVWETQEAQQSGKIRILHSNSFMDDPTRIYRALRFAVRYHYLISLGKVKISSNSLNEDIYRNISISFFNWLTTNLSLIFC